MEQMEYYRPVTQAYDRFERYGVPQAEARIAQFISDGEPVSLWSVGVSSDLKNARNITLTEPEINRAVSTIAELCGVPEEFHDNIRILKQDVGLDNIIWTRETTFGENHPSYTQILEWLADQGWANDNPNDHNVGLALDTDIGLLVVKKRSEEIAIHCSDCWTAATDAGLTQPDPYNSCDHYQGVYDYEIDYGVSLFPKNAVHNLENIGFEVSRYHDNP